MKDNDFKNIVDQYKQGKIQKSEEAVCKTHLMSEIKRAAKAVHQHSGKDYMRIGIEPDSSFNKE